MTTAATPGITIKKVSSIKYMFYLFRLKLSNMKLSNLKILNGLKKSSTPQNHYSEECRNYIDFLFHNIVCMKLIIIFLRPKMIDGKSSENMKNETVNIIRFRIHRFMLYLVRYIQWCQNLSETSQFLLTLEQDGLVFPYLKSKHVSNIWTLFK